MIQDRFTRRRLSKEQIDIALDAILCLVQVQKLVSFAYLHGSVLDFLRGERSILPRDIDVAIYLSNGDLIKVELDLQHEFYARTGLSPELLDIHTLNSAPISVAMEILRRGKLLFCRNGLQHADFIEQVSTVYRKQAGLVDATYA